MKVETAKVASEGQALVNEYNKGIAAQLPALSPLHDTFRSPAGHRGFKRNWTSR